MEEIILHMLSETVNVDRMFVVELFDSTATSERITEEGEIATANVDAHFWKHLPTLASGRKIQRLIYDQHTLQNRMYLFGGNIVPIMRSAVPLFIRFVNPQAIAFPDDGAAKRFSSFFAASVKPENIIICKKIRGSGDETDKRIVTISDGDPTGKDLYIVDDLVRSGNTLLECAVKLKQAGAASISFFVTHAEFPCDEWHKFIDNPLVSEFYTTDS
jgi:hypoxanthine-guanine phosphoribosyltransferase